MSPKDPEPILRPSRYLLPTRSSILVFSMQRYHNNITGHQIITGRPYCDRRRMYISEVCNLIWVEFVTDNVFLQAQIVNYLNT